MPEIEDLREYNGGHTQPFKYDPYDPLAPGEGESKKANQALRDYCMMGAGRSLRRLIDRYLVQSSNTHGTEIPPTTALSSLGTWSARFSWVARADDYDKAEHEVRRQERQRHIIDWEAQSWDIARQMMEKAIQMLKFPLIETRTVDGKTTVEPVRWNMDTIPRMIQVADRMARLSTGTETEHTKVTPDWSDTLPAGINSADLEAILDEMAVAVMAGLRAREQTAVEVDG